MSETTMCYAARYPGMPGYGMITVDRPENKKSVAKDIAQAVREGATIEHVTIDEAKRGFVEYCDAELAAEGKGE